MNLTLKLHIPVGTYDWFEELVEGGGDKIGASYLGELNIPCHSVLN